jgi:uncharacterized protein
MPNRLSNETSPYLLQHANNPVDWYPWGDEAFDLAAELDKPVFLSVGYSACHWCHVMERESFEDEAISAELNNHFVSVKVDREERPDIDQIYMAAVQLITRRGGWPMSVFLTPDRKPFYGGTYWPPRRQMNSPGFADVLAAVLDAWHNRREQALQQSDELTDRIASSFPLADASPICEQTLHTAAAQLEDSFDHVHGGFGRAPKFPHSMDIQLLLREWRRTGTKQLLHVVQHTLDKMAQGGIYDHLAGGFARYSTDDQWLVPHFEKMLYDNAQLCNVYLEAYQVTGEPRYERVVRETLDYIIREMTDEGGGFHSTEDADSEGVEGKFYAWNRDELVEVLGSDEATRFALVYGATEGGNFDGRNILYLPRSIEAACADHGWDVDETHRELAVCREKLLDRRATRIRPGKDDKVLVSWNGLMIDAMARAGATLNDWTYIQAADDAATFICEQMCREDGRLLHSWRSGEARLDAYLDDYACLIHALVSVYEATFDEHWVDEAVRLAELMVEHFHDAVDGGFFYTADDHEQLIARKKDYFDSSVPSGNGAAACALMRLSKLTGRSEWLQIATRTIESGSGVIENAPAASGQILLALDMVIGPMWELVIVASGRDQNELSAAVHQLFLPARIVAARDRSNPENYSDHLSGLFESRLAADAQSQLYVCQDGICQQPVYGTVAAKEAIARLVTP